MSAYMTPAVWAIALLLTGCNDNTCTPAERGQLAAYNQPAMVCDGARWVPYVVAVPK